MHFTESHTLSLSLNRSKEAVTCGKGQNVLEQVMTLFMDCTYSVLKGQGAIVAGNKFSNGGIVPSDDYRPGLHCPVW